MNRHWSINGRFLTQSLTGVQRHAQEVVQELDAMIGERHPAVAGLTLDILAPAGEIRELPLRNIPIRRLPGSSGHVWEQAVLPLYVRGGLLSLGNTGPISVRRQIVCIHDMNVRLHPESYSKSFRMVYGAMLPILGRTARHIATVSHFSAGELDRFGIAAKEAITIVPNGHEHTLRWVPAHTPQTQMAASRRTVVLLGSLAPHKNIGLILRLAPKLATRGISIAVVGGSDPSIFASVGAIPDATNVNWLGRLSDNALAALLRDSLCLAFPSLTEGFGLPPLEAMAFGCPVVVSDRGSLPEVCGEAALYASPDEGAAWLEHLTRLASSESLPQDLSDRGKAQAQKFRWRTAAEIYAGLMQQDRQ